MLCLAAVGRQPPQYTPDQARDYAEMGRVHRTWLEAGRSEDADTDFLERHREYYEVALPTWPRWNNVYRTFVEADLGMDVTQISFGNLAKCRANEADTELLARVCQQVFPVSELVAALRPIAVVVAMLNARGIVRSWQGNSHQPLVWTFQGRNGKGQDGRRFAEWGPDLADAIRARMS